MSRLSHNTLWNLLGNGLPLLVGLMAIPSLLHGLGVERFGLLTLVWATLGYFSFLDLGLGRATTRFVARHWASDNLHGASRTLQVSLFALFVVGLLLCGALWAGTGFLLDQLGLSAVVSTGEVSRSLWVVAVSIPVILVTAGARGALEGQGKFRTTNLIKLPANVAIFLLPLAVLAFTVRLDVITLVLALSRLLFMGIYLWAVRKLLGAAPLPSWHEAVALLKQLLAYGGWVFLAVGLGTLMSMGYLDRLFLAGMRSVADISYYAVPMEIVLRALIIPGALAAAIFPVFSASKVTDANVGSHYMQALRAINLLMLPLLVVVLAVGEDALGWWIDGEFASQSYGALQILVFGLLFNSVAHVPYTLLQAIGRPNVTAMRHVFELPFYLLLLWLLIEWLGVGGAALTWMLWAFFDMWLLFWLTRREGIVMPRIGSDVALIALFSASGFVLAWLPSLSIKFAVLVLLAIIYLSVCWKWYLNEELKHRVMRIMRPSRASEVG
ncbi:MAG: MATE family efflux transporter [Gammaproteobacteria bacterium]|nr:MATE family efflux transporter [Gammaproteobacteria bacterium]